MNIDEQIEYIEQHLKDIRCLPLSDHGVNMFKAILKTLKEVKSQKRPTDLGGE